MKNLIEVIKYLKYLYYECDGSIATDREYDLLESVLEILEEHEGMLDNSTTNIVGSNGKSKYRIWERNFTELIKKVNNIPVEYQSNTYEYLKDIGDWIKLIPLELNTDGTIRKNIFDIM